MCSNTSLSSGCCDGCVGGDNGGCGIDGLYPKKPKRQRVPKRGPGVAELEKILREQETKNVDFFKARDVAGTTYSLVSSISTSFRQHRQQPAVNLPLSHSITKTVTFAAHPTKSFSPPSETRSKGNGGKTGVQIGGSGSIFLPEQTLLPSMWNSCDQTTCPDVECPKSASGLPFSTRLTYGSDQTFPSHDLMQSGQFSPSSIINLFPHSTGLSKAPSSPPIGIRHSFVEPPSNQISYQNYPSNLWPGEEKMVGTKRSRSPSMEIPPVPAFRFPVSAYAPQMNRMESSFSCGHHSTVISVEPDEAVYREVNAYNCFEPKFKKLNNNDNYGEKKDNFYLFGTPKIPPLIHAPQQERLMFNHLPFRESMEDSHERAGEVGLPADRRAFYGISLEQGPTNLNLNNEAIDTGGDGIDLNLKL